ncbi:MAG TPA: acylneuraminate cytidylyltransferase family protein [Pyrinomonadaceae bacterium]|nr:acylneuraminate cytidylyltransferase family protein [Pyrinomonadaceae bacterium]
MEGDSGIPSVIALIPARSGSKRVQQKNVRVLGDHPVIAYTIAAAQESGIFAKVLVSTDSEEYAAIARHYGADVPFLRPPEVSGDLSPDIEWVDFTLNKLREQGSKFGCFSILRPTSPFRQAATIRRAWNQFLSDEAVDSLRAVEKCKQHPGKMWVVRQNRMTPLLPLTPAEIPWHSRQYQSLPEIFVQNASLEIAWSRVVFESRSISGTVLMPFFTEGYEGFDINDPIDWQRAQDLVESGDAHLPHVFQSRYPA